MNSIDIRVRKLRPGARLPNRSTPDATGLDVYSCLDTPITLGASPRMVPCGIALEFPPGYDVQVRPRSGLSARGVGVAFGTIDADYRGELLVTMWTFGGLDEYVVNDGDRVAQLVVAALVPARIVEASDLAPTARGASGHGSTGR